MTMIEVITLITLGLAFIGFTVWLSRFRYQEGYINGWLDSLDAMQYDIIHGGEDEDIWGDIDAWNDNWTVDDALLDDWMQMDDIRGEEKPPTDKDRDR